jgi:hypothetical protein
MNFRHWLAIAVTGELVIEQDKGESPIEPKLTFGRRVLGGIIAIALLVYAIHKIYTAVHKVVDRYGNSPAAEPPAAREMPNSLPGSLEQSTARETLSGPVRDLFSDSTQQGPGYPR